MSWWPLALQLDVIGVLGRIDAGPPGHRAQRAAAVQVVVDRVVEDVHLVEAAEEGVAGEGVGPRGQLGVAVEDPPPPLRIAQGGHPLVERESGDLEVRPRRGEDIGRGLQPEQDPDGPGCHLGLDVETLGLEVHGQCHQVAPALGRGHVLLHGVADRAPAGPGERGDQFELGPGELVVGGAVAVRQELEDAAGRARAGPRPGPAARAPGPAACPGSPPCWCGGAPSARSRRRPHRRRAPARAAWPSARARRHRDARWGRRPGPP